MFRILSKVVSRAWPIILLAWFAGAYLLVTHTPRFQDVARDDDSTFLPSSADSNLAKKLLKEGFPDEYASSIAAILVEDSGGLKEEDFEYVDALTRWLKSSDGPSGVLNVFSATTHPLLKSRLVSKDGQAVLIQVNLDSMFVSDATHKAVDRILEKIRQTQPPGLNVAVAGDAALGRDYSVALQKSLLTTTGVTCLFLLFVLFSIYRSPVAPVVPLLSIGLSFVVSRSLVAYSAWRFGLAVPPVVELFLIVILFGAGTDYCLFLIARFREEMGRGLRAHTAAEKSLASVGEAIWASASTVVVGLGLMFFCRFGAFRSTGPFVALGLIVTLVVALSFTPSLMWLLGPFLLWPAHPEELIEQAGRRGFWNWISRAVGRHPGLTLVLSLLLLLPVAIIGMRSKVSYDIYSALPRGAEVAKSLEILRRHFTDSEILPVRIVFRSRENLWSPKGLDGIHGVTQLLLERPQELAEVRSAARPLGKPIKELEAATLSGRVSLYQEGIDEMSKGLQEINSGLTFARKEVDANRSALKEKAEEPFLIFFSSPVKESYIQGAEGLEKLSEGLAKASDGISSVAKGLERLKSEIDAFLSRGEFSFASDRFLLRQKELEEHPELKEGFRYYISEDGFIGKIEVHLVENPYSLEAMETLPRLRRSLKAYLPYSGLSIVELHFGGATAVEADVKDVTQEDLRRMMILIGAGVFFILFLMLRSVVTPLYLLGTILLGYFATLGIVALWFVPAIGLVHVDWKVQFFVFVLLVAIGMDYNIFLMSRVKEESKKHPGSPGITRALASTGGVISSCGVVMAGTFAALMTNPIKVMLELGFALALGIIMDTFFIRPILVPSIAILLSRFKLVYKSE